MERNMVIDMHCDTVTHLDYYGKDFRDNDSHISLKKLQQGNYLMQCFAIYIYLKDKEHPFNDCSHYIDVFERYMRENAEEIRQVTTAAEIEENRRKGLISAMLTVEEGGVLEGKIENLEALYRRGVRMMTLTWNFENEIGFPNYVSDWPGRIDTERGLKPFGFETINRMWDLGMIVDISHLNDAGIYDVLSCARKPIVASHSNARAICDVPRNLSDDMIRKLAANGGVMGLNYCADFVSKDTRHNQIPDLVEHARHIAEVGGIETVALGSDFDGISTPIGMSDCTKTHELYEAMRAGGFSESDCRKIFNENFLRVLRANENNGD